MKEWNEETYLNLRTLFYVWLDEGGSHEAALDALLEASHSRATGLWRQTPDSLILLGFRGVSSMPQEVKSDFARATAEVPLTETGFAVVSAAVTGEPSSGNLEANSRGLEHSSNWLARFEAIQSLAVPSQAAGRTHGVLAISSANRIETGDAVWRLMTRLAQSLAPILQEPRTV